MNTADELTLKEIIKIVAEFKENVAEAGSEHERRHCESVAFHAILGAVEWNEAQKKPKVPDEADKLIEEERLLDDRDGTIAGRSHE